MCIINRATEAQREPDSGEGSSQGPLRSLTDLGSHLGAGKTPFAKGRGERRKAKRPGSLSAPLEWGVGVGKG